VPGSYPTAPRSYILKNDNGIFSDVTAEVAPELSKIGMVTSALWSDFDNDNDKDLIIVGEWLPISIFKNDNGYLKNITVSSGLNKTSGWWNSIAGGDFDNDGDIDYIAGNYGNNSIIQCSENEPATLFGYDLDDNGFIDPILCFYKEGVLAPYPDRDLFCRAVPSFSDKFQTYKIYGEATVKDIFSKEQLSSKENRYEAYTLSSSYIENLGNEKFMIKPLPIRAQVAPNYGLLVFDFNADKNLDVLLVGNSYSNFYAEGPLAASRGLLLLGDGKGDFSTVLADRSGISINKDSKALAMLYNSATKKINVIVTNNNNVIDTYEITDSERVMTQEDKSGKIEYYYGGGYLSQSTRYFTILDPTPQ